MSAIVRSNEMMRPRKTREKMAVAGSLICDMSAPSEACTYLSAQKESRLTHTYEVTGTHATSSDSNGRGTCPR